MRSPTMKLAVALLVLSAARPAAQTASGSFSGIVTRDTIGTPVPNADVMLTGIDRTTRSAADGSFKIANVPAGQYHVVVRAVGYEIFQATIDIAAGKILDAEIGLTRAPVMLDTVKSSTLPYPNVPFTLQEFESRRRSSPTGYFVTDSLLRRRENEMMSSIVSHLPGARIVYGTHGEEFLGASHGGSGKPVFQDPSQGGPCLVTVYLDGFQIFPGSNARAPDFSEMRVSDFSAVEFYPDATEAPVRFQRTGTGCGLAMLWSRVMK